MQYALLGQTGVWVSRICVGTFPFGVAPLAKDVDALIGRALERGINFIDTANSYGDQPRFDRSGLPKAAERESSEALVGKALRGRRHEVILATKVQERMSNGPNGGGVDGGGLTRLHIMQQIDRSLQKLQTDYVDIYHAHHPDPTTPMEQTLRAFDDLVRQGKIRYYALSDHPGWMVAQAVTLAQQMGIEKPVCHQVRYSLADRSVERDMMPSSNHFGLSLTAFSPLGGGLLTGPDKLDRPHPGSLRFAGMTGSAFNEGALAMAAELERLAAEWGYSAVDVALAWVLSRPGVVSAITGPETIGELEADLPALDIEMNEAQLAALDALSV